MPVLLLTEDDVRQLLTMEDALAAVETGLRKLALDEAENVSRSRCRTDHVMLHVLSAAAKGLGYVGFKAYTTGRQGARFVVGLYDGRSGDLLALIQADYLGQVRTGAASGVATRYLARPEAETIGLFGTGKQARTQLLAVCKVRTIRRVHVFSRTEDDRQRFAAEMSEECGVEVIPVDQPETAARDQDIVITATTSREPVLYGDWLADGAHVNAVGSNFLGKAEVDVATLRRASVIVVDSKEQAHLEAGDLSPGFEKGVIHWPKVVELGPLVLGQTRGRQSSEDITLFKSVGIAIEDVAVAAHVYTLARKQGVGRDIEW